MPNNNALRVLILGSPATQAALISDEGQDERINVVGYVARTTLASQACGPCRDKRLLAAAGAAQARLEVDFRKTLNRFIAERDYDWLVLDFIAERFHLYEWTPGAYVTASPEFLKAAAGAKPHRIVRVGSSEYFKHWVRGFKTLVDELQAQGRLERLRINRLWWAERDEQGNPLDCSSPEVIDQANRRLAQYYQYCQLLLGPDVFLDYPPEQIRADPKHPWGCAPYNYSRVTYQAVRTQLLAARPRPLQPARLRVQLAGPALIEADVEHLHLQPQIAFYLYRDGAHLVRRDYGSVTQAQFERPPEAGSYSIKAFLRGDTGAILALEAAPLLLDAAPITTLARLGSQLIHQGHYRVGNHPPVEIRLPIDWDMDPFANRSWRWAFLQLDMLPRLLAYDQAFDSRLGADLGWQLIISWQQRFAAEPQHPDAWHDHATAMRAQHLLAYHQHLQHQGSAGARLAILQPLLLQHAQCLSQEAFYSRGSNHGFDQALALGKLAEVLTLAQGRNEFRRLARRRIADELHNAIVDDGGHVENSPAYLNYGLKQALDALPILHATDAADHDHAEHEILARLERSIEALAHMIRPDGTLPLIGDTFTGQVSNFLRPFAERFEHYPEFLYAITEGRRGRLPTSPELILPHSGYAVFRDAWRERKHFTQAVHLVIKCGFLSTYHRHDDDLHLVLMARGIDWLVDGGLYNYHQADAQRIHARSARAHNLSLPYGEPASRDPARVRARLQQVPSSVPDGSAVLGHSTMFPGYSSQRRLDYDRRGGRILIEDRIDATDPKAQAHVQARLARGEPGYVTRFQVPASLQVIRDGQAVILRQPQGRHYRLQLRPQAIDGTELALAPPIIHPAGQAGEPASWYSRTLNTLEPLHVIEYQHHQASLHLAFVITLP